ncbi:MAG: hypothetical protein KGL35_21670 [Bradyrhizobium sp.]|nr:hypothetical protein [Bradyrhizobium sp.]
MTRRTTDFAGTDVLGLASERAAAREPLVPSTVVEARGPASARVTAKTIFDGEEIEIVLRGRVRGGSARSTIAPVAIETLETENPQIVDVDLGSTAVQRNVSAGQRLDRRLFPRQQAS